MKLYTVVVHNLQMWMKEYRCCLKFRRGDNSTYTFTKRGVVYLVSAPPPKRLIGVLWNFSQLWYATCRCAWRNMVAVQNLKEEIQLILSRKGGHVPCKRNSCYCRRGISLSEVTHSSSFIVMMILDILKYKGKKFNTYRKIFLHILFIIINIYIY